MKNWNVLIYTHCPEGTHLSWEWGENDVSRGFHTERKLNTWISLLYVPSWSSCCSCHPCPVRAAVENVNRTISQLRSPLEKSPGKKSPVRFMQPLLGPFLPFRAQDNGGIDWAGNSWRKIKPPKRYNNLNNWQFFCVCVCENMRNAAAFIHCQLLQDRVTGADEFLWNKDSIFMQISLSNKIPRE